MPYKSGSRLSGERASKLGHLDVIKSELVNELVNQFETAVVEDADSSHLWSPFNVDHEPLPLIFAVDGSLQTVRSDIPPYKELSFVKTALLRLDQHALSRLDQVAPHPMALRDIMADSAMYHATVLPLKGVSVPGRNNYHAVRQIIYESMRDASLSAEPFETLKWLAYRKWSGQQSRSPSFECPHCKADVNGLAYDSDTGNCEHCSGELYLTDMVGFHLELGDDVAPESVATAYMLIHETMLLFTGIRYFWERQKYNILSQALFIKDGPLTLRSQYSKLVEPIRDLFERAKSQGITLNVMGQEKTGKFVDHLGVIAKRAPERSVFGPSNDYIRREVQNSPERSEPYGSRTNYGNKLFVKTDRHHFMVINVPTGSYKDTQSLADFIGLDKILSTLPSLVSYRHECALVPVELANGVASLSSYPSAAILKVFSDV